MNGVAEIGWLAEHYNSEAVRIIDCRFQLSDPSWGRKQYEEEHIPYALYFDLNEDLSGEVGVHGGRHPLPEIELFAKKISAAGIDKHTTVIAYDSQNGAMASRLWWLLTYLGHEKVYILNGGFTAWKQAGLPTTDAVPVFERKEFLPHLQSDMLVSMTDVKNRIESGANFLLIDSREPIRYAGIEEPIDRKAGHIPTAVNSFWMDGVSAEGLFQGEKEQEARFGMFDKEKETIVYCGSGVTACPNVLALKVAGFQNVKLYAGSWSDWISYDENIVEKTQKIK